MFVSVLRDFTINLTNLLKYIHILYMNISFFNEFGNYGPWILLLLSNYLLWKKDNLLFYYNIGFFINAILNIILKGIFQQPRPSEDAKKFDIALKHGKRYLFKDGMPYDMFGMPSGHSQSSMFSSVFIYLSLQKMNILYLYLFVSFVTMAQRVSYNYHTMFQVIVGGIIGASFGYLVFSLAEKKMKNIIREKPDEDGPI